MPKTAIKMCDSSELILPSECVETLSAVSQNYLVTKSNKLIREARSNLTITQNKMIAYIISRIEPEDTEFGKISFSIKEFCQLCDIPPDGMYVHTKKALKQLRDKSFWFKYRDENGIEKEETFSWINKVYMNKNAGTGAVELSSDLKPFLLELKENFTSYRLKDVMRFKSKYSHWFYENIARVAKLGSWTVSVEEIKDACNVTYEYKMLRVRVIEVALSEINNLTDYNVRYGTIKNGRKVESIKFVIEKKEPQDEIIVEIAS